MKRLSILLLAVFCLAACDSKSPNEPEDNLSSAIDFTLSDADANTYTLSDYSGKVVVLNFFATWCAPCQDEMPRLDKNIWQALKNEDIIVLGINLRENIGEVKLFAVNNAITFPLAIDNTGEVFRAYAGGDGVTNVPYNVIIDKKQKIQYSQTGYNESEMKSLIEELLK